MASPRSTSKRRQGATTRRSPRKQARAGIPGWLWGLAGLIAGFALSQYFHESAPPMATVMPKPSSNTSQPASSSSPTADQPATPSEPRMPTFEFYTLLPESEVVAPQVEEAQNTPNEAAADLVEADSAVQASQKPNQSGSSYMLQAASFKQAADAQRLADRLKNFGLMAKITKVLAHGDQTWHRVQVGPYQDNRELNRAQDLMVTQGIEPLLIKLQN